MKYKATSKRDIIILAHVLDGMPTEGKVSAQGQTLLMWVPLMAHKPVDGLGKILGIDPRCVHETKSVTKDNFTYVPIKETENDYLKEHFGLFKIEPSAIAD